MCKQKITENEKRMQIANCRICLLCKSHCADCPLNWALKIIEIEKSLKKVIENPKFPGFETRVFLIEIPIEIEVI